MILFTSNHQYKQHAKTSTGSLSQAEMSRPRHLPHTDRQTDAARGQYRHLPWTAAYTPSQSLLLCKVHACCLVQKDLT